MDQAAQLERIAYKDRSFIQSVNVNALAAQTSMIQIRVPSGTAPVVLRRVTFMDRANLQIVVVVRVESTTQLGTDVTAAQSKLVEETGATVRATIKTAQAAVIGVTVWQGYLAAKGNLPWTPLPAFIIRGNRSLIFAPLNVNERVTAILEWDEPDV